MIANRWMMQGGDELASMPAFLQNCIFYFDKDLSNSVDTGTLIVTDKSNVKNNISQSDVALKPAIDATDGLIFDNTGDRLQLDHELLIPGNKFTIYFRYNKPSSGSDAIFGHTDYSLAINQNRWCTNFYIGTTSIALGGQGLTTLTFNIDISETQGDHLFKIINNASTCKLYIDGIEKGSLTSLVTPPEFYRINLIGSGLSNYYLSGNVKQIMVFNKDLTTEEQIVVESQLNLPQNIPNYKTLPEYIVYLQGQSNATGRENLSSFDAPYQDFTNFRMWDWGDKTLKNINDLSMTTVNEGTYRGFEMSLCKLLYDNLGINGIVFKYGIGGTPLYDIVGSRSWNIARTNQSLANDVWPKNRTRVIYFKDYLKSLGKNIVELFEIWMQGESDADQTQDYSDTYQVNEANYITQRRLISPNLPFISYNIAYPAATYRDTVRAAKLYNSLNLNRYYLIETNGYASGGLHYTVPGLVQGGIDAYNIFINDIR